MKIQNTKMYKKIRLESERTIVEQPQIFVFLTSIFIKIFFFAHFKIFVHSFTTHHTICITCG